MIINCKNSLHYLERNIEETLMYGDATITATTVDGTNLSAQCLLHVDSVTLISQIVPSTDFCALTIGTDSLIMAQILPDEASYPGLQWTSSNDSIATVTAEGRIHAVNVGSCCVMIQATDSSLVTAIVNVQVLPIFVTALSFSTPADTLIQGNIGRYNLQIAPADATFKDINWDVTDSTILRVDSTGLVTALKAGTTYLYAYATDGSYLTAGMQIVVLPIVSSTITAKYNKATGKVDLTWAAQDYVKNVKDFNVYVSEDDGDYILWLPNTPKTSASYQVEEGRSYRFTVTMRNSDGVLETYDETKNVWISNIQH